MGIPLDHPATRQALEKGLIRAEDLAPATAAPRPDEPREGRKSPELVSPSFTAPGCWILPTATTSETNNREWRKRSNRSKAARAVVSRAFGPHLRALAEYAEHYHRGGALKVTFTRLGGKRLDRANLGSALKATEDATALMLGADDGDPRWQSEFEQEPGGAVGVRVELSIVQPPAG